MINRLINMEVPSINTEIKPITNNTNFTVKEYATSFIDGMSDTQKQRFKKMLENGIQCGQSVAENYGINYNDFIQEVKKQMGVM